MAYSDVIIRQCGPRDADSDNDLRILWRMLKMMKTGFIRYLLAIIFMSAALSVFDMITALLFKNIIFSCRKLCTEEYVCRTFKGGAAVCRDRMSDAFYLCTVLLCIYYGGKKGWR